MKIPCIRITQPIGDFYLASLNTELLKDVTYSRAASFRDGELTGNQRSVKKNRINEIREYISTHNAALPNSIIISANFDEDDNLVVDPDKRWYVEQDVNNEDIYHINIPDPKLRICSIIDGQHRVNGFNNSSVSMSLPCSIFIDLPPPSQALIFSTINFNQKPVDKSLAYQLFGYQLDESDAMSWSPDILAVKISRELNQTGVLQGRIELIKGSKSKNDNWTISSAAFIEGINSLISGNPRKDKYEVNKKKILGYGSRSDLKDDPKYPLRKFYIDGNDQAILTIIDRYFNSLKKYLWKNKDSDNIIFKTVGISSQFSLLKEILSKELVTLDSSLNFDGTISKLEGLVFNSDHFSPRTATKKKLLDTFKLCLEIIEESDVDKEIINIVNNRPPPSK
ncbi:DGQHR domain-containing protein [Endozoicomonas atrinae]|uniref:DGQHR domain-containing protein n=1 Tax=Endozoicomonas atrinae TaxID=1333660 RepID=UPI000824A0DC|nr:DGQHR domain-containing protein [Endozoicomonas atrinae]